MLQTIDNIQEILPGFDAVVLYTLAIAILLIPQIITATIISYPTLTKLFHAHSHKDQIST